LHFEEEKEQSIYARDREQISSTIVTYDLATIICTNSGDG